MNKLLKAVSFLTTTIAVSLAAPCLAAAAEAPTTDQPAAAKPDAPAGLRIFYASHSLMWDVPPPLAQVVSAYGITNHTLSIQRMGFSRTQQFWDQAEAQSDAKKALKAGNTDVFVMSPMDMPDKGVEEFVKLGILNNPNMRFFVQNNWAGFNNDGQKAQQSMQLMMSGRLKQWDQTTEEDLKTLNTECEKAFEAQVKQLNEQIGRQVIFIIPTSQANSEIRARIIRKEFPGLDKQSDLFLDQIGHPKPPLVALNAYLHFATVYGRSPVGLPMPTILRNNSKWDENFNKALQELAWKTVVNYPLSGVKAPGAAK